MHIFLGVVYHLLGGFAAGSFYVPYKKVKGWAWENYWIAGGVFSWVVAPLLAAYITIPHFLDIIVDAGPATVGFTYMMGLLWGVGGLTYGLGVRYLGMSLGNSVVLGFCSAFGSLVPPLYYDYFPLDGKESFSVMMGGEGGIFVLAGVVVCLTGIFLCGKAGMLKEKEVKEKTVTGVNKGEFNMLKGLLVAVCSGILSACFNFGIEAGKSMASVANETWKQIHPESGEYLFQNNVTFVVVLLGGFTINLIWCLTMIAKNKTFGNFINTEKPINRNYFFSFIAGTTWFLQFFFYGMGESRLGNGPSSWILHMAFIIIVGNAWGLILKEWRNVSRRTFFIFLAGIAAILLSVLIVGYGNYT